jgi:galactarate dehydratase
MSPAFFSRDIPSTVAGTSVGRDDMARVTEADWAAIVDNAHRYCRKVDATRPRTRANGSATITQAGIGTYGTDDVSDDVAQDAVLIFARRLGVIIRDCAVASVDVASRESDSWQYQPKDADMFIVDRSMIRRWAVRDAAERNGYRPDRPTPREGTREARENARQRQAEHLATVSHLAGLSDVVFRMAWADGRDFPTLRQVIKAGSRADDLGRAGIFANVAQKLNGGTYGSRRAVIKTRDAALAEWRDLAARCDDARRTLTHRGTV